MSKISIDRAKTELNDLANEGKELINDFDKKKYKKWKRNVKVAVSNIFGDDSNHLKEVNDIRFSPPFFFTNTPSHVFDEFRKGGIQSTITLLESMIEEIDKYWHESIEEEQITTNGENSSNEIFIVHGHDDAIKESVARFITQLDLKPIILHEQPNEGKSLLSKFESNASKVGFAIVLLTSDDIGASKKSSEDPNPRARQNVVFELGFFIAALSRENVCPLVHEDIEIPSDYDGIGYIPIDKKGGWKLKLVRELKAAGYEVDANKAI